MSSLWSVRRSLIRSAPMWLRLRLASQVVERMVVSTYRDCHVKVRWSRQTGELKLSGSLFCVVREPAQQALCEYYASAVRRLLELSGVDVEVTSERCRAKGAEQCAMTLNVRG